MKNRKLINSADRRPGNTGLLWPPLLRGVLQRRYKRFLADIELDNGAWITAHCPNSGSMLTCSQPGQPVWVSVDSNPRRKYPHTWQLIAMPGSLVGVNTLIPNRLLDQVLHQGLLPAFSDYTELRREVTTGQHSRLDLLLTSSAGAACYIEIKNCTLVEEGIARFPDAISTRGTRHLEELDRLRAAGHRAVIFFMIQRMDAGVFRPADDIDVRYGQTLRQVVARGVEIMAYDVQITLERIELGKPVPVQLD